MSRLNRTLTTVAKLKNYAKYLHEEDREDLLDVIVLRINRLIIDIEKLKKKEL